VTPREFEDRLARELTAVGITGRLRGRLLDEFADHLACEPDAPLGEPGELARQFADELGTARARRAAIAGFAALAVAGILFGAAFLTAGQQAFGAAPGGRPLAGRLATGLAMLSSQVAFVAGGLAALRWLRRRGARVVPAAEAAVIVRRAGVGVLCGIATMVSLGTIGVADHRYLSGAWATFAVVAGAVGTAVLLAALPAVGSAARLRPVAEGRSMRWSWPSSGSSSHISVSRDTVRALICSHSASRSMMLVVITTERWSS
jgi:hypothetical protein